MGKIGKEELRKKDGNGGGKVGKGKVGKVLAMACLFERQTPTGAAFLQHGGNAVSFPERQEDNLSFSHEKYRSPGWKIRKEALGGGCRDVGQATR